MDGQQLAALEKFVGENYVVGRGRLNSVQQLPGRATAAGLGRIFFAIAMRLVAQGPFAPSCRRRLRLRPRPGHRQRRFFAAGDRDRAGDPLRPTQAIQYWGAIAPLVDALAKALGVPTAGTRPPSRRHSTRPASAHARYRPRRALRPGRQRQRRHRRRPHQRHHLRRRPATTRSPAGAARTPCWAATATTRLRSSAAGTRPATASTAAPVTTAGRQ